MKSKIMFFLFMVVAISLGVGCTHTMQTGGVTDMQQVDRNKEIVKMYLEEVWNRQNIAAADKYLSENYMRHSEATPPPMNEIKNRKMLKGFAQVTFKIFPDWHEDMQFIIADGDKVMYMTKASATQVGKMGALPATNKKFTMSVYGVHRLENGKIVETWQGWDNMVMMRQLGLFPPPGKSK